MNTDMLKDKTIKVAKGTVKTTGIVLKTSKESAQTVASHASNMIVNYTPDIYDAHQDFASGAGKFVGGNTVMVSKNVLKINRSLLNATHKSKYKQKKSNYVIQKQKYEKRVEEFKREEPKLTRVEKVKRTTELKEMKKNVDAIEHKMNKQAQVIRPDRGFSAKRSFKATVQNQTRRMVYKVGAEDDMGSKTISKTTLAVWGTSKYKQTMTKFAEKSYKAIKSVVNGILALVASLPAIIAAIATSIPILIIVVALITVLSLFDGNLEFSGRVSSFSQNQLKLENAYQTSLSPDEILAISQTLGWTTEKCENYEVLLSFICNQKRPAGGAVPSFEQMMDNVFNKYNPARKFGTGAIDENASSGYTYYHNDEKGLHNLWNSSVKHENMTNEEWLSAYPQFKNGSIAVKNKMASDAWVNEAKATCRDLLEKNGYNYMASFLQIDDKPTLFKSEVIKASPVVYVTSPVGYRNFSKGAFHHGLDVSAPQNTPVYACMDGKVIYADGNTTTEYTYAGTWGCGNSVVIRKDFFDSKGNPCYLYAMTAHLQPHTVTVKRGDNVKAGTQIGGVGTTGTSTDYHLHFQVWISDKKYDNITDHDFVHVSPINFTDAQTAQVDSVEDGNYYIYLDGLMLYDGKYRNELIGR